MVGMQASWSVMLADKSHRKRFTAGYHMVNRYILPCSFEGANWTSPVSFVIRALLFHTSLMVFALRSRNDLYREASQGFPFPLSLPLPSPLLFFPAPSLSLPFPSPLKPWVSEDAAGAVLCRLLDFTTREVNDLQFFFFSADLPQVVLGCPRCRFLSVVQNKPPLVHDSKPKFLVWSKRKVHFDRSDQNYRSILTNDTLSHFSPLDSHRCRALGKGMQNAWKGPSASPWFASWIGKCRYNLQQFERGTIAENGKHWRLLASVASVPRVGREGNEKDLYEKEFFGNAAFCRKAWSSTGISGGVGRGIKTKTFHGGGRDIFRNKTIIKTSKRGRGEGRMRQRC